MSLTTILKKLRNTVNVNLHAGQKFECPICGYHSKDLMLIGLDFPVLKEKAVVGAGRRYGGCYKCGASDREKLIFTFLSKELKIFENKSWRVLHLAPEKKISDQLFNAGFEQYVCGDLFTEGYQYPAYVQNMNVLDIPYPADHFDLIICNHLLEHVPNDLDAMKELFRTLKPNGRAILQVPISKSSEKTYEDFSIVEPQEREKVFGQFDHVRIYGQDYVDRLESIGFKVERLNISDKYGTFGLNADEDLFIGKKN